LCQVEKLALALLVLWVLADYTYDPIAVDDFALNANLFYRCTDLHFFLPFSPHPILIARANDDASDIPSGAKAPIRLRQLRHD